MLTEREMRLVSGEATDCLGFLEVGMDSLAETPHNQDGRCGVVMRLLRASLDNARGIGQLLRHDPSEMATSALVLHRSQLEKFVRAVWFEHAPEDEADYFLANGRPSRPPSAERPNDWRPYSFERLCKRAGQSLQCLGEHALLEIQANHWADLCDFAHGGTEILRAYGDQTDEIGCTLPARVHFHVLGNGMFLAKWAIAVAHLRPGGVRGNTQAIADRARAYVRGRDQRLNEAGIQFGREPAPQPVV